MKYYFTTTVLILFLVACQPKNKEVPTKTTTKREKLKIDSLPYLSNKLEEVTVGELSLPSGKIIAGDPFFVADRAPFNKRVTPGRYPVRILITKIEADHYRIAFARIVFNSSKAVRWEMAIPEGTSQEEIDSLKAGEIFGYPVDAGLGCFIDAEVNKTYDSVMNEFYKQHPDGNYYDDVLAEQFKKTSGNNPLSREDGDWCNHLLTGTGQNLIMFASGWGDGFYPSYWGYDINGQLVELVTDFLVLGEDEN